MKRGSGCCAVDIYCIAVSTSFSNSIKLRNIFIFGMAYFDHINDLLNDVIASLINLIKPSTVDICHFILLAILLLIAGSDARNIAKSRPKSLAISA